jgi:hypothetical protein
MREAESGSQDKFPGKIARVVPQKSGIAGLVVTLPVREFLLCDKTHWLL